MSDPSSNEELLTALFHALRAPRRRQLIEILSVREKSVFTVRELSRTIASYEQQVPVKEATGEPYRNVYNALSQTHLSTLRDAGVIIYDPDRQTIMRGRNFELALLLLDTSTPIVSSLSPLLEELNRTTIHSDEN